MITNKAVWQDRYASFTLAQGLTLAGTWAIIIAVVAMSLGFSSLASAQSLETIKAAEKVAKIEAKADVEAAEIAAKTKRKVAKIEADAKVDEAKAAAKAAKKAPKPAASDEIGIAADNKAVTTVTYRAADGTAYEGSKDWAKHEENMAKIKEGPGDPCRGKMAWLTCPFVPVSVVPVRYFGTYGTQIALPYNYYQYVNIPTGTRGVVRKPRRVDNPQPTAQGAKPRTNPK